MGRDIRLDMIRGLILIWMTVSHLGEPLRRYSYEGLGFISVAEAFVFISGLVAGMVYTRMAERLSYQALSTRARHRARDIYGYHLSVYLLILVLVNVIQAFSDSWGPRFPLFTESPLKALGLGIVLLYQPTLMDILPMYCLYILFTPLIIYCFQKNRTGRVFLVSLSGWIVSQFGIWGWIHHEAILKVIPLNLGIFDFFAWQFLFIVGLWFGFKRQKGYSFPFLQKRHLIIVCFLGSLFFFLFKHHLVLDNLFKLDLYPWLGRQSLGPLRLVNFFMIVYLVTVISVRLKKYLEWRALAFLGRHSLQVFTFHVLLVYLMLTFYYRLIPLSWVIIILFNLVVIAALFIPAWIHSRYRKETKKLAKADTVE